MTVPSSPRWLAETSKANSHARRSIARWTSQSRSSAPHSEGRNFSSHTAEFVGPVPADVHVVGRNVSLDALSWASLGMLARSRQPPPATSRCAAGRSARHPALCRHFGSADRSRRVNIDCHGIIEVDCIAGAVGEAVRSPCADVQGAAGDAQQWILAYSKPPCFSIS